MVKLVRDLTFSYEDVLTIHAEGSLEAQKVSILSLADFDGYKAAAKKAAEIEDSKSHPGLSAAPGISAPLLVKVGIRRRVFPPGNGFYHQRF